MKIKYFRYLETLIQELGSEVNAKGLDLEQINQLENASGTSLPQAFQELLTLVGIEVFQINDEIDIDISEILEAQKIFKSYVKDNRDVKAAEHDFFILIMANDEPILIVSNENDSAPLYWVGPDQLTKRFDVENLADYFRQSSWFRRFLYKKVAAEKRQCLNLLLQRLSTDAHPPKVEEDFFTRHGFRVDLYFPDHAVAIWIIDPERDEAGERLANVERGKAEEKGIKTLVLKSREILANPDAIVQEISENYLI